VVLLALSDMSQYRPESRFWLSNHFLNCVTSGKYKLPIQANT